jgi:hypothetical protein
LEPFWCINEPRTNTDSQDSPRSKLKGSQHLPPYSILCAWPWGQRPNVILSQDSQVGIPKFSKLGLPQLWKPITLCVDLQCRWGLKQSYSPSRDLFNVILHTTYTQGNQGDSRLLMVESQIANLILDLSFGHNLYLRYPNGSCEPILDIYVPRFFQWYKELFNPMNLDPSSCPLKIQ